MKKQSFGDMVAALRKEKGMTQLELAEKMGVTDKAVSKWERDLSFPDVSSIPRLAELFDISVDQLMQVRKYEGQESEHSKIAHILDLSLKAVALAMGISALVLSLMNGVETAAAVQLLGIGLACLAAAQLAK